MPYGSQGRGDAAGLSGGERGGLARYAAALRQRLLSRRRYSRSLGRSRPADGSQLSQGCLSQPTLPPVSPGYIPGGPQLPSYPPADTPAGFPWVYPRGTTTAQLPTRRHSRRFPLGTSQGDHNCPATHPPTTPPVSPGYIPGGPQLASYPPADTPSGFPWVYPGDHNWPATHPPTLPPVSPGYIPGGPQLASYPPADTPAGFPWVYPRGTTTGQLPTRRHSRRFPLGTSQGDHNWPATHPPTLPPVSPGYIPGGPQLASYPPGDTPAGFPWVHPRGTTTAQLPTRRHSLRFPLGISQGDHNWPSYPPADTPSGFPWVYPRGTTTGQLPTGPTPMSGRAQQQTITPALCRGRNATASGVRAA